MVPKCSHGWFQTNCYWGSSSSSSSSSSIHHHHHHHDHHHHHHHHHHHNPHLMSYVCHVWIQTIANRTSDLPCFNLWFASEMIGTPSTQLATWDFLYIIPETSSEYVIAVAKSCRIPDSAWLKPPCSCSPPTRSEERNCFAAPPGIESPLGGWIINESNIYGCVSSNGLYPHNFVVIRYN